MRSATLPTSSCSRRCLPIVIANAGSSTVMSGIAFGFSGSARVSPIVTSLKPATATSSPGPASSTSARSLDSVT